MPGQLLLIFPWALKFLLIIPVPCHKTWVFTANQGTKKEKFFQYNHIKVEMPTRAGNKNTLTSHLLSRRTHLSHLSEIIGRTKSAENGQQSAHFCVDLFFTFARVSYLRKKVFRHFQTSRCSKKMMIKMKKNACLFYHRITLIANSGFAFSNEEKLLAMVIYYSFRRVSTSMFRKFSVFSSSVKWLFQLSGETEWMPINSGFLTALWNSL